MQKIFSLVALLAGATLTLSSSTTAAADSPIGYKDTPHIPSRSWHVHDPDRSRPHVVTSAPTFSYNAGAPSDAIVLFDGKIRPSGEATKARRRGGKLRTVIWKSLPRPEIFSRAVSSVIFNFTLNSQLQKK